MIAPGIKGVSKQMTAATVKAAKGSTNNRARATNDPRYLHGHSGWTPAGRRRRDLVAAFVEALGGPDKLTPVQLIDIRKAAELTALAEEQRGKALCDGIAPGELAALVRLEGSASRATKALGIKPAGRQASPLAQMILAAG